MCLILVVGSSMRISVFLYLQIYLKKPRSGKMNALKKNRNL